MFSRRNRLPRAQFPAALRSRKRASSPFFTVVAPEEMRGFAVVIPKKVVRSAVGRHRLKRRVLEALKGIDHPPALIVFPCATAVDLGYDELKASLKDLISTLR